MDYQLTIHLDPGGTEVRHITADPTYLAQAVHRHVRGILGSRRVTIHLDPDTLTGTITNHGAHAGHVALTTGPDVTQQPLHPMHGYTIHDIDYSARLAMTAAPRGWVDGSTRFEIAWSAIAEYLVTTQDPPPQQKLIRIGWAAIAAEVNACLHARGYLDRDHQNGPVSSPRYVAYWRSLSEPAEDRLVDHLAAIQIREELTPAQRRVVQALADWDDHTLAAEALGMESHAFETGLSRARRRFLTYWYAPETPPSKRRRDRRRGNQPPRTHCSAGHELAGDNLRIQRHKRGRTDRVCRACERERGQKRRAA